MTQKLSRKKLIELLEKQYPGIVRNIEYTRADQKICAYLAVASLEIRQKLEAELPGHGFVVCATYFPGKPVVEVTNLSYFKAPRA